MKNIYLVLLIVIAIAVFVLGMALFVTQRRNPQATQTETGTTQQSGNEVGGAAGSPVAVPLKSLPATESAPQP